MMSIWVIIALVFLVLFWRERREKNVLADHKRKLIERVNHLERVIYPAGTASNAPTNANRELEELRARVKVLERIATDENSIEARKAQAIAAEIEALRGDMAERATTKEDQSE